MNNSVQTVVAEQGSLHAACEHVCPEGETL